VGAGVACRAGPITSIEALEANIRLAWRSAPSPLKEKLVRGTPSSVDLAPSLVCRGESDLFDLRQRAQRGNFQGLVCETETHHDRAPPSGNPTTPAHSP